MNLQTPESRVVAIVRVPSPWWAPRFVITGKFVDSIPQYAMAPGLEHKAYTFTDDRRFGGVYLWRSRAAAEAWFNEAWHARVRAQRGVDGDVQLLDARWTIAGDTTPAGRALPQHSLRTDAAVTWLRSSAPVSEPERALHALAATMGVTAGLIRVSLVTEPDGHIGAVSWWASRAAADAFWSDHRKAAAAREVGSSIELLWLDAPVLLDADAAQRDVSSASASQASPILAR